MKTKIPRVAFAALILAGGHACGETLVYEGFDYSPADLTGNNGGSGWTTSWTDSGNPTVVRTPGLTFTDPIGNTLNTHGSALNTADGGIATTISAREVADRNAETWISVLIQPQGNFTEFIGVSFYDQGLATANARFAIEHAAGKDLRLTRRAGTPSPLHSASFATTVGTTVLAVIHLIPDGGVGVDTPHRLDVFFNPNLDSEPGAPHASLSISGLQFDRVRIAGQNGKSTVVDELRIGETYADVTPFTPAGDPDSDGDGLTDSREAILGLDPFTSDIKFIAALRANPGFVGIHSPDEITEVKVAGLSLEPTGSDSFEYGLEIRKYDGTLLESITRPVNPNPDNGFFRLALDTP